MGSSRVDHSTDHYGGMHNVLCLSREVAKGTGSMAVTNMNNDRQHRHDVGRCLARTEILKSPSVGRADGFTELAPDRLNSGKGKTQSEISIDLELCQPIFLWTNFADTFDVTEC